MYYYIDSFGQQQGPIAANDLPRYGVTAQTFVWRQGMSEWQPARTVPELSAFFAPPQMPPVGAPSMMPAKPQTKTYETGKDLGKGLMTAFDTIKSGKSLMITLIVAGVVLACAVGGYFIKQANDRKAFTQLLANAERGDAEAQSLLGRRYYKGDGVTQDYAQAASWSRKAAEQGDADAQNMLGLCYEHGRGVKQSIGQAALWYRAASEQGHREAQRNLGRLPKIIFTSTGHMFEVVEEKKEFIFYTIKLKNISESHIERLSINIKFHYSSGGSSAFGMDFKNMAPGDIQEAVYPVKGLQSVTSWEVVEDFSFFDFINLFRKK